ncbi:MAG TPA: alpha/beta hydrolase [Stellaceae bacterium]|nr:alpha/beta hydrolase [Stellaceae bacterium]
MHIAYRGLDVDGLGIFYRESGKAEAPAVLLLHGFPTSGHMFRELIPLLSDRFHVVAPDLPGFGRSDMPRDGRFRYTFANLARVIDRFTETLGLERFAIYVFDYGAPVGLRMALAHPERITAIVTQNGNAYEEGLSRDWDSLREYWRKPTPEYRESLRAAFTPAAVMGQYTNGVADASAVSPDGPALDSYYLSRPGAQEVQLDLFADYGSNVALYPEFQKYFRDRQPPLLAVWGRNDPYFLPAGARAFRRDIDGAEVTLLDTGHFALETHHREIAAAIRDFLDRKLSRQGER